MALIGNGLRLSSNPMRYMNSQDVYNSERSNWDRVGNMKNMFIGQAGLSKRYGCPPGYNPFYCWITQIRPAGLSSKVNIVGSGNISGTLTLTNGFINMSANISGSGTMTATAGGTIPMNATITGSGGITDSTIYSYIAPGDGILTKSNVGSTVWDFATEGTNSAADLMRLMSAILAGKDTIVNLGGGLATVTFRDINDTKNRVVVNMTNSTRTSVTLDISGS